MPDTPKFISVCICTYKRPLILGRLLKELSRQKTDGLFEYSFVVVDNDDSRTAEAVVTDFCHGSSISGKYLMEPKQNIALARNKAIENAEGDLIAFIDDDEIPTEDWLLTLFVALNKFGADGVLGPVRPHFDVEPPDWVVQGKFYERPSYSTGFVIDWKKGRTGNVLLKRSIFTAQNEPFRSEFRTGEDQDFFRRMIAKGHRFIWCEEAVAYEVVPPMRWKRTFMLKRALLQGANSRLHPSSGPLVVAKSSIAFFVYLTALPIAFFSGHSRFMTCLLRLCDHMGRLLAFLGINAIKEPYVTE